MSWSKNKKLITVLGGVCATTLLSASFFVLASNSDNNTNVLNNNLRTIPEDKDVADTFLDFPLYVVKKSSSPNAKNILITSEAFSENDINKFIPYAVEYANRYFKQFSTIENSELFNIYALSIKSKDSGANYSSTKQDTYFEAWIKGDRSPMLSEKGYYRLDSVRNQFEDVILNKPKTKRELDATAIIWNSWRYGGAARPESKHFVGTTDSGSGTWGHELSHIFGLGDEYGGDSPYMSNSPNQSKTGTIQGVKWKEFLGYDAVGIRNGDNYYIPKNFCLMNNSSKDDFCPVCERHIFRSLQSYVPKTQRKSYFSEPAISQSVEETLVGYNSNKQSFSKFTYWQSEASEQFIDLRTMVENFSGSPMNLKLVLEFSDKANPESNKRWEQTFTVSSNELKQLKLKTDTALPKLDHNRYSDYDLVGYVMDANTNQIIRKSSKKGTPRETILSRKQIDVDFVDQNNKPIKNVNQDMYASVYINDKECNEIGDIQLPGYKLISKDVNFDSGKIIFRYKLKDSKTLDLVLVSNVNKNTAIVKRKTIELYEGEIFTPTETNYWFQGARCVPYNNKPIKYSEAQNNQQVYYLLEVTTYGMNIKNKNIVIKKGQDYDFESNAEITFSIDHQSYVSTEKPEIRFNNFNNQVAGNYTIIYSFGEGLIQYVTVTVTNDSASGNPDDSRLVKEEVQKAKSKAIQANAQGQQTYIKNVTEQNISSLTTNWPQPQNGVNLSIAGMYKEIISNRLNITLKFSKNGFAEFYTFDINNFKQEELPPKFNVDHESTTLMEQFNKSYIAMISGKYLHNVNENKLKVWSDGEWFDYSIYDKQQDLLKINLQDKNGTFYNGKIFYVVYDGEWIRTFDVWTNNPEPPTTDQDRKDIKEFISSLQPMTLTDEGKQKTLNEINATNISQYVNNWPESKNNINIKIHALNKNFETNELIITFEFSRNSFKLCHSVIISGFKESEEIKTPNFNHDVDTPINEVTQFSRQFNLNGSNLDLVKENDLKVKYNDIILNYQIISRTSTNILIKIIGIKTRDYQIINHKLDCYYKDNKVAILSLDVKNEIIPPPINNDKTILDNYVDSLSQITLNEQGKKTSLSNVTMDNISRLTNNWPQPINGISMDIANFDRNPSSNSLTITFKFTKGNFSRNYTSVITGFKTNKPPVNTDKQDLDNYVTNLKQITLNYIGQQTLLKDVTKDNIVDLTNNWPQPINNISISINSFDKNFEYNNLKVEFKFTKGIYSRTYISVITGFKKEEIIPPKPSKPSFDASHLSNPIEADKQYPFRFKITGTNLDKIESAKLKVVYNTYTVIKHKIITKTYDLLVIELDIPSLYEVTNKYNLDCLYEDQKVAKLSLVVHNKPNPPIEQEKPNTNPETTSNNKWKLPLIIGGVIIGLILLIWIIVVVKKKRK